MARVRMVTRTVDITEVEAMQIDISTAEVSIVTYHLSGKYTEEKDILKLLNNERSDTIKVVSVQSISHSEVLYGMLESEFIKLAKVLPPRFSNEE